MNDLQPLGNHVLIEPIPPPDKVGSGLLVAAESYRQPSGHGTVISVGPGRLDYAGRLVPPDLTPGDKVVYSWINGRDVHVDGKVLKLLDAQEILGKFNKV